MNWLPAAENYDELLSYHAEKGDACFIKERNETRIFDGAGWFLFTSGRSQAGTTLFVSTLPKQQSAPTISAPTRKIEP
jgi:hypothetical protein